MLIESTANNLLKGWRQHRLTGVNTSDTSKHFLEEIENVNALDAEEQDKHFRLRMEKDNKIRQLRFKILQLITIAQDKEIQNSRQVVDLPNSSLSSGTSLSMDGVDLTINVNRILKNMFFIEDSLVYIKAANKRKNKCEHDEGVKLGDSYYGKVYKGTAFGRDVCVKILSKKLDEKQVCNIINNYESVRNVGHNHLLSPIAAVKDSKEPKILFELLDGPFPSLQDYFDVIQREAKMRRENQIFTPVQKIRFLTKLKYGKEICACMAWLHGQNIYHLRLKPSNILFTKNWNLKIVDYGLDLPCVSKPPEDWIHTGHAYFYPLELLEDSRNKSPSVDVYSFGLILYSLLSGKIPYTEAKTIEQLKRQISEAPVSLDSQLYPPSMVNLINSCLSNDPKSRPLFRNITSDVYWIKLYQDMNTMGHDIGNSIWREASGMETREQIPWDQFSEVLWRRLGIGNPNDIQKDCVKEVLYLDPKKMVKQENWVHFLHWFAPLRTDNHGGKEFIERVVQLLKAPWFYGVEFERDMCDDIISGVLRNNEIMKKHRGKYPFLVRISPKQNYKYIEVYYDSKKKEIIHEVIDHEQYFVSGIYDYIVKDSTKRRFFPAVGRRPFDRIFNRISLLEALHIRM